MGLAATTYAVSVKDNGFDLMPIPNPSDDFPDCVPIAELLGQMPDLSTSLQLLTLSKLTPADDASYTLFVPTNDAWLATYEGLLDNLKNPDNSEDLQEYVKFIATYGFLFLADLQSGPLQMLNDENVTVDVSPDGIFVNDAELIRDDITGCVAVVQVIDRVLLPQSLQVPGK
eukprot:CFRG7075T1